jgi:hypothetical protein
MPGGELYEFLLPAGLLDGNPPYWYAVVGAGTGPAIRDYKGVHGAPAEGAVPRVLVLEPGAEWDCFVSRYDVTGGYITEHGYPTREQALEDLAAEFGDLLGSWKSVPEQIQDAEHYALTHAEF